MRRIGRRSEIRPITCDIATPESEATIRNTETWNGFACTAVLRNNPRNGPTTAVATPEARKMKPSGSSRRDRRRVTNPTYG
ncbi:hypothetical protein Aoc01nite_46210 [Actinoplanes octamycinicus]|nr:hypothetical protein Aoc01nite_46210 [Actinoplanes octamycinicus]